MFEQGLIMMLNAGLASPPFAGGHSDQLPPNPSLPDYYIKTVSDPTDTGLQYSTGLAKKTLEINCIGNSAADAQALATRIFHLAQGYRGILPDPDATQVDSMFRTDIMDFPMDPDARNYRRMLEFEVNYYTA